MLLARQEYVEVEFGTSDELIEAASLGARVATRRLKDEGLDATTVRRLVLEQIAVELHEEGLHAWSRETVIAAVIRAIEDTLDSVYCLDDAFEDDDEDEYGLF